MKYSPKLLVVEDDVQSRTLFENILASDGYLVTAVSSAVQALTCAQDFLFEVIIADMSLPDRDGAELIRDLAIWSPYSKVLAISGHMNDPMRKLALEAGATAALPKPMKPGELRKAVYRLLDPTCSWMG
ncbi:MAG: response regulator [Bryobacteraceae bacterium]